MIKFMMVGIIRFGMRFWAFFVSTSRSEEHTSELQSQSNLVCRLLLEKKKHINHVLYDNLHRQIFSLALADSHTNVLIVRESPHSHLSTIHRAVPTTMLAQQYRVHCTA